ncbi:MAG: mannose-1-phosphate guanylyltransferase [Geminicoccaceae bacterium]
MSAITAQPFVPVLLAGGSGTRLWPISRQRFPKHLTRIVGQESFMQEAARRALQLAPADHVLTVGAAVQEFDLKRQLGDVQPQLTAGVLLEPSARNTAAACGFAAHVAIHRFGPDACLWICPSDHVFADEPVLVEAVARARTLAAQGHIVTFGIQPSRAETGFGYIEAGEPIEAGGFRVARFVEKPPLDDAIRMVESGRFQWNSGMFVFRAATLLDELNHHAPAIAEPLRRACGAGHSRGDAKLFASIPSEPIDKAVMEKSAHVAVLPIDPGWSDLGTWQAIWEFEQGDDAPRPEANVVRGDVVSLGTSGCYLSSTSKLVAAAGVQDLAVIETSDAVLVAPRNGSDAVKALVGALAAADRPEVDRHLESNRPWGTSRQIEQDTRRALVSHKVRPDGRLLIVAGTSERVRLILIDGEILYKDGSGEAVAATGATISVGDGATLELVNTSTGPAELIEIRMVDAPS